MKVFNVLVVEDDDVDVMNIERAFAKNNITNPIHRARDGVEALEMLRAGEIPSPIVVFLDLSMPRMGGHEFLQELREDPEYRTLPVVVMTVSTEESDKLRAYDKLIQGYVVKPLKFDEFVESMANVNTYWTMCELP